MKRSRGRGRRPQSNHHHHNHNHLRTFDSNGPDVKIRGAAAHIYEKYLQLARDAGSAGDRVMAESYLQHAEHYYRILAASQAQQAAQQAGQGSQPQQQPAANGNGNVEDAGANGAGEGFPRNGGSAPSFTLADDGSDGQDDEGDEADAG